MQTHCSGGSCVRGGFPFTSSDFSTGWEMRGTFTTILKLPYSIQNEQKF